MTHYAAYAAHRIQARVDPTRIPGWLVRGRRPRPFWYDPARQVVHRGAEPDGMLWDRFPIHDPYWG